MNIKEVLEEKKTALLRKKAELEVQSKMEADVLAEMQKLGVTPETIDDRIAELEEKLQQFEKEAEKLISEVEDILGGVS